MLDFSGLLQVVNPQAPSANAGPFVVFTLIKMIIVFTVYMVSAALLTLAERTCCSMPIRRARSRIR